MAVHKPPSSPKLLRSKGS